MSQISMRPRPHSPQASLPLDPEWRDHALHVIQTMANLGEPFTVDRIRCLIDAPPHPNHYGALFSLARHEGILQPIGYTASATRSRHRGVVRVWGAAK